MSSKSGQGPGKTFFVGTTSQLPIARKMNPLFQWAVSSGSPRKPSTNKLIWMFHFRGRHEFPPFFVYLWPSKNQMIRLTQSPRCFFSTELWAMVDPRRAHHTNESAQSNHLRIDEGFCHILDLPVRCLEKIFKKSFPKRWFFMVIYQGTLVEVTFKSKTFKP